MLGGRSFNYEFDFVSPRSIEINPLWSRRSDGIVDHRHEIFGGIQQLQGGSATHLPNSIA